MSANCFDTLKDRGFVYQWTQHKEFFDHINQSSLTFYAGFDATADSFHIGNLVILMMVRWLALFGHKPIVLIGGGTTQVGDPLGRTEMRPFFENTDYIHTNEQRLQNFLKRFLPSEIEVRFLNNKTWLGNLPCLTLLRDIGQHFSLNRMIAMDTVKQRLEAQKPFSFLELSYVILQSYDYWHLHQHHGCQLQIGGADQWANILGGVDLIRRKERQTVHGLTCPLITTASGQKMGKTHDNAVWLEADKLSPYEYWQFWRNVDDQDIERFLKLYTMLPLDEITRLASLKGQESNEAKIRLAEETTFLIHGIRQPEHDALPTFHVQGNKVTLAHALQNLGFAQSLSQGRRLIQQGGVFLDRQKVEDPWMILAGAKDSYTLTVGKRKKGKISFQRTEISQTIS